MKKDRQDAKVYRFDPDRKKKLKSVDYVSPEKKQLLRDRKQAKKDRKNFFIGVGIFILLVAVLSYIRLNF